MATIRSRPLQSEHTTSQPKVRLSHSFHRIYRLHVVVFPGEYFRGARDRFELPFGLQGTEFQLRVWNELKKIPFGKTWSYRELAERVGNPGVVRDVGSANGRNPVSIVIPCHRVVRTGGGTGRLRGGGGDKAFLLDLEMGGRREPARGKS